MSEKEARERGKFQLAHRLLHKPLDFLYLCAQVIVYKIDYTLALEGLSGGKGQGWQP